MREFRLIFPFLALYLLRFFCLNTGHLPEKSVIYDGKICISMAINGPLNPDPLITSTVEVRFNSALKSEDVLSFFSALFLAELPKLHDRNDGIPRELKQLPPANLSHLPDYLFQNEKYSVSVGKEVIAFEHVKEYTLWPNYFSFIQQQLQKVQEKGIIQKVHRVGLRYASIFERVNKASEALRFRLAYDLEGYRRVNDYVRTTFQKQNIHLLLQVGEHVKVNQRGRGQKEGLYIDIDASQTQHLPDDFSAGLLEVIDQLHTEEKALFEQLLRPEFLARLQSPT